MGNIHTIIVAIKFEDPDRELLIESLLENSTSEHPIANVWEIDTKDWKEDAWWDWNEKLERCIEEMDLSEDNVTIWKIKDGQVERETYGY